MYKLLLLSVLLFFAGLTTSAQIAPGKKTATREKTEAKKKDSTVLQTSRGDSIKPYVNMGKIAGRRAAIRSAMLPGLGQIRNGFTFYRGLKVAGIYTGATLLTISYMDNSKKYNIFLDELEYRAKNNNQSPPGSPYASSPTDRLTQAKDIYRRNKQVIIFSYVGLYLLNIVEAYIDARLANFDVGDVSQIKVTPDLINTNTIYGFNPVTPGIKLSLTF
ncbi:DUF5683 domain-containing protein [Pedobacter heparinus]|uniref:DUF5683 domain-containing protein n=1 Tax=Pedobacter heparinus (strain ATCC 13125 / DSM 2366 / CIP 104194 / JCM 7457 / NBRC 12017 / NCIMB 9290 / NRRL B-14731 / HIM 762-3) TaxID=485917 RepID=C6XTE3_PEDHD|nr:DUF5683 domain-containing protein [Pedobacter heparinus]ACU05721.1 conserved hypothetical protein [Pedobacter heparinus DSM 2366]